MMARRRKLRATTALVLGAALLLLAGCSPPGTYPDQYGPRSADGFLVDPHTGIVLPGQPDHGI
jgi:hypothetical protein